MNSSKFRMNLEEFFNFLWVHRMLRKIYFLAFFYSISLNTFSKNIEIPSEIRLEKYFASFDLSYSQTSSIEQKIDFTISLHPNGNLNYRALYFGGSDKFCHNDGGRILKKIDISERKRILSLALKANNENQKTSIENLNSNDQRPLLLSVELGDDFSTAKLDESLPSTKEFKDGLFDLLKSIYQERSSFEEALKLKIRKNKKSISYELKNIGKKTLKIFLDEKNKEQFYFKLFDSPKIIPLAFKNALKKNTYTLLPNQSFKILFKIPKFKGDSLDFSKGRFFYDSTSKFLDKNYHEVKNELQVHLCE